MECAKMRQQSSKMMHLLSTTSASGPITSMEFRESDTNVVMMSNHGAVVVGPDADVVLKRCIILEDCCRILAHSIDYLRIIPSTPLNIKGIKDLFLNYG